MDRSSIQLGIENKGDILLYGDLLKCLHLGDHYAKSLDILDVCSFGKIQDKGGQYRDTGYKT